MCDFVLRASDGTECGNLIILHLKNLALSVLGVLICVQKLYLF